MEQPKHLVTYGNCVSVEGHSRSIICDLQRMDYDFIPNSMVGFMSMCKEKSIQEIKGELGTDERTIIDDYINFLITKDYAFIGEADEIELFPALNNEWDAPFEITNILIDIDPDSNLNQILNTLEYTSTDAIQFRFYDSVDSDKLKEVVGRLKSIDTNNIQLILPYSFDRSEAYFINLTISDSRLNMIYTYNAPVDSNEKLVGFVQVVQSREMLTDCKACGIFSSSYFTVNTKFFTESQYHNTCLNRKISIDVNGNIKNCPSMLESYGNIENTTLKEALVHPDFKKFWNIKKDDIDKCRDCEFRHICTDCRAFRENPEDIYSAPLKCGYDPYTNKWEEWSKNPLKQKAIAHYGLEETILA